MTEIAESSHSLGEFGDLRSREWTSLVDDVDLLSAGIRQGCSFEGTDPKGRTLLHMIVETGLDHLLTAVFHHLEEKGGGANILPLDALDQRGWTPLHLACFLGHWEIARKLLSLGAMAMIPSGHASNLPLHFAVAHSLVPLQKCLTSPPSAMASPRKTFPRPAVGPHSLPSFRALVQSLASVNRCGFVNFQNDLGETPLFVAVKLGREQAAQQLLQNGADVSIENHLGDSPLAMAVCVGKVSLVALLVSYRPLEYATALCLAEQLHRKDLVAVIRSLEPFEPFVVPLELKSRYLVGELVSFETSSKYSDSVVLEACFCYELALTEPPQAASTAGAGAGALEPNSVSMPTVTRGEGKKGRHSKSRSISIASRFFGHGEDPSQASLASPASPFLGQAEKNAKSRYLLPFSPLDAEHSSLFRIGYDPVAAAPVYIQTLNTVHHQLHSSDLIKLQLQLLLRQSCIMPPTRIASTTRLPGRDVHSHLLEWMEIVQGDDKHQLHIISQYIPNLQPFGTFLGSFQSSFAASPRRGNSVVAPPPLTIPEPVVSSVASQLFSLLLHLHRLVQLVPQLHSRWTLFFRPDDIYIHRVEAEDGSSRFQLKLGIIGLSPLSFSFKHDSSRVSSDSNSLLCSWFHNWCDPLIFRTPDLASSSSSSSATRRCSVLLMPPEQIDETRAAFIFGETISVWFLGVFLFQLLSGGRLPFTLNPNETLDPSLLYLRIATLVPSELNFDNIPERYHADLLAMLQPNPFERICLEDLCRSPVWANLDPTGTKSRFLPSHGPHPVEFLTIDHARPVRKGSKVERKPRKT